MMETIKSFNELLPDYLITRKIALGKSTYKNVVSKMNNFSTWLTGQSLSDVPVNTIDSNVVGRFFNYLAVDRDLDKATCIKYRDALTAFFHYTEKRGYTDYLPFDMIVIPQKKRDHAAKVIPKEVMKKLLPYIRERNSQLFLFCMFEYYGCLRPGSELRLMKVGEIDFDAGVIRPDTLTTKSRRQDVISMPKQLIDLCYEFGLDKEDKNLFVFGKLGKPGLAEFRSENTIRWQFNKYRDELGLSKSIKLYSFKCTGLTHFANSGAPMRSVMDHARHTSLNITQHYLQRNGGLIDSRVVNSYPSPD